MVVVVVEVIVVFDNILIDHISIRHVDLRKTRRKGSLTGIDPISIRDQSNCVPLGHTLPSAVRKPATRPLCFSQSDEGGLSQDRWILMACRLASIHIDFSFFEQVHRVVWLLYLPLSIMLAWLLYLPLSIMLARSQMTFYQNMTVITSDNSFVLDIHAEQQ